MMNASVAPVTSANNRDAIDSRSTQYPRSVRESIKNAPRLFVRGNTDLLNSKCTLAIVGSRLVTPLSISSLTKVLGGVSRVPLTIVSGLALGIDAIAHAIALENLLPTIAVLGSSIEQREVYPRSNARLAEQIVSNGGLLVSPFPPGTPVKPFNFPARNQIIAALAQATLVASAAKKSGALITARHALDYGRDVFVIPGSVTDPLYEGSNELFCDGAVPLITSADILDYFGLTVVAAAPPVFDNDDEQAVWAAVAKTPASINELIRVTKMPSSHLQSTITKLELRGDICRSPDGTFMTRNALN